MYRKKKQLTYDILIPPLDKPFPELTPAETQRFFDWYMDQIPARTAYLSATVSKDLGVDISKIDLSPESLVPVWQWFLKKAKTERTPQVRIKELSRQYSKLPHALQAYMLDTSKEQFSLETEYILRDIGMYLGEVFVKNHSAIQWSYYCTPKRDFFVNRPLLAGFENPNCSPPFKMFFEPIHMVGVQAANIWSSSQDDGDLFNLYNHWVSYIP